MKINQNPSDSVAVIKATPILLSGRREEYTDSSLLNAE